jgi:HEAT repeat protein
MAYSWSWFYWGVEEDLFPKEGWRGLVAGCLGEWGHQQPEVIPGLIDALINDHFWVARRSAAQALGEARNGAAIPTLITSIKQETESKVRKDAAIALRDIIQSPLRNEEEIYSEELKTFLYQMLAEPDKEVLDFILQILMYFHEVPLDERMLMLLEHPESGIRMSTIHVLGRTGNPEVIPILLEILQTNEDRLIRKSAVSALSEFNDPIIIPAFIAALENPEEEWFTKCDLVRHLVESGENDAIQAAIGALEEDNDRIKSTVIHSLGETSDPSYIPIIQDSLHDEEVKVREQAVRALKRIGTEEALQAIEEWETTRQE